MIALPYGPTLAESTAYASSKKGTGWLIVMTSARAPLKAALALVQLL